MVDTTIESESLPEWQHGGDLIARQLKAEGVKHIFTLTGGHIAGIFDGARFQGIKLVDFRHEQAAVHAADAYGRISGKPGVAALTAGPGVTNGLTGIANAYYANSPLVVLGGRNPFALGESGNLQDAPQLELTKPICKYSAAIYDFWRIPHVIREAFAHSMQPRFGPSYVDVPMDVQLTQCTTAQCPPLRIPHTDFGMAPSPEIVGRVADLLTSAKQPLILVGSGAYWSRAGRALDIFLRKTKIPVYLNGMARGLLGRGHPYQLYSGRSKALQVADCVLLLGIDLDFRLGYGQGDLFNPGVTLIQVDPDGAAIGKHRDIHLGITADIDTFLGCMNVEIDKRNPAVENPFISLFRAADEKKSLRLKESIDKPQCPVNPERFVLELLAAIPENAIVIGDGGDIVALFAEYYRPAGAGCWMDPGPFGCLGIGIPFAMGAALASPTRPVIVVSGDGSFGFNAMELDSCVRQKIPFVLIIGNDGAWGEMRTFHEDIFGPYDKSAQYLSQGVRYEQIATALGGFGQRVETAGELCPAIEKALSSGLPSVINVILDPAYRRTANTISGKHIATAYGNGDPNAYKREEFINTNHSI